MSFFKSFQNELGRNTAKYVSNKILGEFGWSTPRRHIITGEERSNYTSSKSFFKSINSENTNSEISNEEIRQQNANYKEEYLSYLNSISTYHTIRSNDWVWTKGEKGKTDENDWICAVCGIFPKVFTPFTVQKEFVEIRRDFKEYFIPLIEFLHIELIGIKEFHKETLILENNESINEISLFLNNTFNYHVTFNRNDEVWKEPESSDLDTLLMDLNKNLKEQLNPEDSIKGWFSSIFNPHETSINLKIDKVVEDIREYCEAFIEDAVDIGNFQQKIIKMCSPSPKGEDPNPLFFPIYGSSKNEKWVNSFFDLVSELGHFDRFNEEGLCLKFNDLIAGIVMFDLYIDPKIKVPENKIGTIYNDLKLKIEPLTNSEFNEILHNMIASLIVSLGIEIKVMNVKGIESIGINVYLPNPNLEDQLCLRLVKEIDFFSNSNLSKMNASKLFSLFSDSELTLNYSRRSGFSEI